MKIIRSLIFLFFLFLSLGAFAQMNNITFTEYDLDNGMHVILHEDHSTPIVVVSVMYHVGSKNEDPERTGFAHFFEHLLFEGSENIDRGEFDEYIQRAGGANNANTSYDRTYYYELLPSNQVGLGIWLESERLLHAKVQDIGIETQRQVVKEERRQRVDNQPYGSVVQEIFKRAYKEHPYRWPVIGDMEHLDAAQEQDYKQFYEDFYVPENAVLSIAGDINQEEVKELISKYFSTIPCGGKEIYRPKIVESPLMAEIRDTVYDNIQLPAVVMGYRIPAQGTKEFYAVELLGTLLSQGASSRFNKSLVDDKQLAVFSGSFPFSLEDPGINIAFGIANAGVDPLVLEKAMDEEIAKVQSGDISERELEKLRNQKENDFISSNSSMAGIAESLANYHMYFGAANLINTEINKFLAVTKEDIINAANSYFKNDKRVVLHYLPKQSDQ